LGHEENDMMRPIVFQVPPPAPSNLTAVMDASVPGQVNLSWIDNSASESSFTVQKASDAAFTNPTTVSVGSSSPNTAFGQLITYADTSPGAPTVYYRVQAVNDNFSVASTFAQLWNATPPLLSAYSNTAEVGAAPVITMLPAALDFLSQPVNVTSAAQIVTLTNAGTVDLAVSSITITGANPGDFAQTNNCVPTLFAPPAANTVCTVNVTFKPAANGARSAVLNINSSNPVPLIVPLTGTGSASLAGVSPAALTFGNRLVGTPSAAQNVTLSNSGTAPLIISSIAVNGGNAGDFGQTNNCPILGAGLATGTTCTIGVVFLPTAMGARSSVLVISSSDPVTPSLNVTLSGTGTQAIAGVSPAALTFPLQLLNTTSLVQAVTLSNTGNLAMVINSIALTGANAGDFVLNYNCPIGGPTPMAAGANCTISVTFRPTASGPRAASLAISTNALVNPNPSVSLSGTGTAVNLSSAALTFGAQLVGTNSAAQVVTLSNVGTTTLITSSVTITGANAVDFTATGCGPNLAPGGICKINVKFRPTSAVPALRVAMLQVNTSDLGVPSAKVALAGTAVASAASLSPTSLNFGLVTLGQTGGPSPVTLTNAGTAALIINSIALGGANPNQFARTYNCPIGGAGLAPGASCTINATFSPTNANTLVKTALLNVNVAAPATSQSVSLTGTINVPIFTLSGSLAFGGRPVGTTSPPQVVTVANTGTAPLVINNIVLGGANPGQFAQTNTCGAAFPATLAAGTNCTINVTFRPTSVGVKSASLTVRVAAPATNQSVTLGGTGQ
jgi:hypothetical protein